MFKFKKSKETYKCNKCGMCGEKPCIRCGPDSLYSGHETCL